MIFGMTRGEIELVVFIFALIYGGLLLPKLGERIGVYLHARAAGRKRP